MITISAAILFFAACFAATNALPAPREIDWVAASAKVEEIQVQNLNTNFKKLIAVATKDNPDACVGVGADRICFAKLVNLHNIIWIRESTRNLEFAIFERKLSISIASHYMNMIRMELHILLEEELTPFFVQLSEPAVKKIKIYFEKIHAQLHQDQGELYDIIMAGEQVKGH